MALSKKDKQRIITTEGRITYFNFYGLKTQIYAAYDAIFSFFLSLSAAIIFSYMVTQDILRTQEGRRLFGEKTRCSRSNQMS